MTPADDQGQRPSSSPHPLLDVDEQARLVTAIQTHGLHKYAERIIAHARPSLEFKGDGVHDDPRLGTTRLGGAPDLPAGTPWPKVEGFALQFLAQVRFEGLPIPEEWPLPRAGLLSVFKGDDEGRFDVEHGLVEALVRPLTTTRIDRPCSVARSPPGWASPCLATVTTRFTRWSSTTTTPMRTSRWRRRCTSLETRLCSVWTTT